MKRISRSRRPTFNPLSEDPSDWEEPPEDEIDNDAEREAAISDLEDKMDREATDAEYDQIADIYEANMEPDE